ncbi:GGDEF domain-containing protein [Breoghania sp.]|uniref:GGDEF domain-containing protein n=1 Tax=Breoghania sp. TaxID=2065378 RepID=UPI0026380784|nr:GGDEF domain-containing protein [Breoghania sp.]MDJ0932038.1 GGDEF domain-containing protein [Breoghania sp.]
MFELATRDALTRVLTRRAILDELERELSRAQRYQRDCSILVVDADHFEQVNDKCGHQVGDEVLRSIADRIRGAIREANRVRRLGGK